jgi:hypothetical protein
MPRPCEYESRRALFRFKGYGVAEATPQARRRFSPRNACPVFWAPFELVAKQLNNCLLQPADGRH